MSPDSATYNVVKNREQANDVMRRDTLQASRPTIRSERSGSNPVTAKRRVVRLRYRKAIVLLDGAMRW